MESQDNVYSDPKKHSLFMTIYINDGANKNDCIKAVANIDQLVQNIASGGDGVLAGVGFGKAFYNAVGGKTKHDYTYTARDPATENFSTLPSTGGDIFIHAKSDVEGKMFELCQNVKHALPDGSIKSFEDHYGFAYRTDRDLSGFIDGTANPTGDHRREVAVEKTTGGSYAVIQRWKHRMERIYELKQTPVGLGKLEHWVGRTLEKGNVIPVGVRASATTSHIYNVTNDNLDNPPFEIVRQSQPIGELYNNAGLFFLAYAKSPENLNFILDQMANHDTPDEILLMSDCLTGSYVYFPGKKELAGFV